MNTGSLRVGKGFDIHRLVKGRPLRIGGIEIPFEKGSLAHSDGDVLIHAVIDSILGAAGCGDIGTHFPDNDPQYKDISGITLLKKTIDTVPACSFINLDMTVFCEEPRLGPFREAIETSVAEVIPIDIRSVNVKAKSMESLGEIGSGNAIAAEAVILLQLT